MDDRDTLDWIPSTPALWEAWETRDHGVVLRVSQEGHDRRGRPTRAPTCWHAAAVVAGVLCDTVRCFPDRASAERAARAFAAAFDAEDLERLAAAGLDAPAPHAPPSRPAPVARR